MVGQFLSSFFCFKTYTIQDEYMFVYIIYLLAYAKILLIYHICKYLTYFDLLYDNRLMNIKYFTILKKITTFAMSKDKNIIKQFKTLWCIGALLQEIWLNIMQ